MLHRCCFHSRTAYHSVSRHYNCASTAESSSTRTRFEGHNLTHIAEGDKLPLRRRVDKQRLQRIPAALLCVMRREVRVICLITATALWTRPTFKHNGSGRGRLLSDSEEQGDDGEYADIDTGAGERVEHTWKSIYRFLRYERVWTRQLWKDALTTNETRPEQHHSLPETELGDLAEGGTLPLRVQDPQSDGECRPDRHEHHFLLRTREEGVNLEDVFITSCLLSILSLANSRSGLQWWNQESLPVFRV